MTVRSALRVRFVVEAAVGQRAAESLVKEQKQQRDLHAFGGETVGVAAAIAFQQAVAFELAQVVAELVQPVLFGGELERGEDGFMDLFGRRAANDVAACLLNYFCLRMKIEESRLMAMFTAYFDASGNPKDQPFIVVSGYVANYLQWQRFEDDWATIHRTFEVNPPFHMAEFVAACSTLTYREQRNARADYIEIAKDAKRSEEFLKLISQIQMSFVHAGISCIIDMDIYREVSSLLDLREVLPPYALGARMCIQRLRRWEQDYAIRPPAEVIFEVGDFEQGKFTRLMVDEGEDPPIYKKKGDFAGLQGADQYAWEQFYFLKGKRQGSDRDVRKPFYFLLESIPKLHTHPSREFLIKLCEAKGIDPRTGIKK